MHPIIIAVIVVAAIVAVLALIYIALANSLRQTVVKIDEADSSIDVMLMRRYDTLTKALDTAKGFVKHEKETLYQTIALRKGMSVDEKTAAYAQLDKMAGTVNVVAEAYPNLRSSDIFVELTKTIKDVENDLQAARRAYNSNVSHLNQQLVSFPSSVVGSMLKLKPRAFFAAEASKKQDVKIDI